MDKGVTFVWRVFDLVACYDTLEKAGGRAVGVKIAMFPSSSGPSAG